MKRLFAIGMLMLLSGAAMAGTTRLFGGGCGSDSIDVQSALPAVLTRQAQADCNVGSTTTGSSHESGIAGPGVLGVSVEVFHNGPGTGFRSGMDAGFSADVTFVSATNDPIEVSLQLLVSGLLTQDVGTGYSVGLRSNLFGELGFYNSSCSCGRGFPPLDGAAHLLTSGLVTVDVNRPIQFDLTLSADVGAGGWPDHISLDLAHTITLNPTQAFVVPVGVTVDSQDLNVANNRWTDPRIQSVPTPASSALVLLGLGLMGGLARRAQGHRRLTRT